MQTKYKELLANDPENLTSQFEDRMTKLVAVEMSRKRAEMPCSLQWMTKPRCNENWKKRRNWKKEGIKNEKDLFAKKCQKPRWGHAKNSCPP